MSQLPAGSKAQLSFLYTVIVEGLAVAAAALWAPFGHPILKLILKEFLFKLLAQAGVDVVTSLALARTFVVDHAAFDRTAIEFSMMDKQNATIEQIEEKLNAEQDAFAAFIRRGAIS